MFVRSEALTAVKTTLFFRDVTPCRLFDQLFRKKTNNVLASVLKMETIRFSEKSISYEPTRRFRAVDGHRLFLQNVDIYH
jgi:hypothetical protein